MSDELPDVGPRPTVRREVEEALRGGMPPAEVAGRAKRSLSVVLGILGSQGWPGGEPVACEDGCPTCCHQRVSVTVPEVLDLADWLRGELPAEALAVRLRAVEAAAARARGKSGPEHWAERIPCGLLEGGSCSAYDARPLACRRGHSTSREACERAFAGEPGVLIPDNASAAANAALFEVGLHEGFALAGAPLAAHELNQALAVALSDEGAAARWAASRAGGGDDPFEAARLPAR